MCIKAPGRDASGLDDAKQGTMDWETNELCLYSLKVLRRLSGRERVIFSELTVVGKGPSLYAPEQEAQGLELNFGNGWRIKLHKHHYITQLVQYRCPFS